MSRVEFGLEPFTSALRTDEQDRLFLDGEHIRPLGGWPEAERWGELARALFTCVYQRLYSQAYPPSPRTASDEDVSDQIELANSTRPRSENGWEVLESCAGGSVLAQRHGRSRQVAVEGGIRKGTLIDVHLPAGSRTRQPGFYHCFSEGFRDSNDQSPIVRIYFNVRLAGAPGFVGALTAALNRYEIPFELKITTRSIDFTRTDNAVLYVARDHYRATMLVLEPVLPAILPLLDPQIPLFAKRLAPGIGFAEDPGAGESFGTSRSKLVASALLSARKNDRFCYASFADRFARSVMRAGLRIDALWLNPGSGDIYAPPDRRFESAAA